jgi:hypothetical protein
VGFNVLANYGGPTDTLQLIEFVQNPVTGQFTIFNDAIDAGQNSLVTNIPTDQRGSRRIAAGSQFGGATAIVDIGAFEVQET